MHVCVKVPPGKPKCAERREYEEKCGDDREAWVRLRLGVNGRYVGRPKNDGGWYKSPTVKAGSMFANPFTLKEYSLGDSLHLFKLYVLARADIHATTEGVIALLPPAQRSLAQRRFRGGQESEAVGRSVGHLRLCVVGAAFRDEVAKLQGLRLGCFCDEADPCHAKELAALAEVFAQETAGPQTAMLDLEKDVPAKANEADGSVEGTARSGGEGAREGEVDEVDCHKYYGLKRKELG